MGRPQEQIGLWKPARAYPVTLVDRASRILKRPTGVCLTEGYRVLELV